MFKKNLLILSVLLTSAIFSPHPTAAQSVFLEGEVFEAFDLVEGEVGPNFSFGDLQVGRSFGVGRLTAREGGNAFGEGVTIGEQVGTGILLIDGFSSKVTTLGPNGILLERGSIEVRNFGNLIAANGGKLAVADARGTSTILIDGAGSNVTARDFELAQNTGESAALDITNGASMNISNQSDLGADFNLNDAGGNALVRVDGFGSSLLLGINAIVGGEESGSSQLLIQNEAAVIVNRTLLINALGTVELDEGSLIARRNDGRSLNVRGTLRGGGQVTSNETRFSPFGGIATPQLEIRNGDVLRFNAFSTDAPAQRIENDGGEFTNFGGTIEVDGDWTNSDGLIAARNATFGAEEWNLAGGAMRFLEGDNDVFGTVVNNAEISVSSEASVLFFGDLVNEGGTLSPGPDAGATSIAGDFTQESTGLLALDIGGTQDLLNIGGEASLDGELQLTLLNGFQPSPTDVFSVLAANNIIGFFANVTTGARLTTTDGTGSFVVNYGVGSAFDASHIILSDFESGGFVLGDINGDGVVNLLDVAPFVEAITNGIILPVADINQDGSVNLSDVGPFVDLLNGE